jgi:galactokinase
MRGGAAAAFTSGGVRAYAPGRVNLIGDHTDYTGGLVVPMAVDRGTTVQGAPADAEVVHLRSADERDDAVVPLAVDDPASVAPPWARYVAGVVSVIRPGRGFTGSVRTTLPLGAGLSSSAALEVAVALALGFRGSPRELAQACQRAEQAASGVPCGVMDQLASAAGVAGHALLIDCSSLEVTPVPLSPGLEITVVHSGTRRELATSAYAERRRQCEAAEAVMGVPLRKATAVDLRRITDPVLRQRARHVVTENARVREFVAAMGAGDARAAGQVMVASHASLRHDFDVSTRELDALVERLLSVPGVLGARLTGAGFGGCVVALAEAGTTVEGWRVQPSAGARLLTRS